MSKYNPILETSDNILSDIEESVEINVPTPEPITMFSNGLVSGNSVEEIDRKFHKMQIELILEYQRHSKEILRIISKYE